MRARSFVLHGGDWGGGAPPQGHCPNDVVNCVRNLPCGGSLGVFWGSGGVREVWGWIGADGGGPREDLEESSGKGNFLFCWGVNS